MIFNIFLAFIISASVPLYAAVYPRMDVQTRMKGAPKISVGTVISKEPHWQQNESGANVIYTTVRIKVEEDLRGSHEDQIELEMEGGTINGLTYGVDSLPTLNVGERGVFVIDKKVDKTGRAKYSPHLKGYGILKLKADNRVENSTLRLEDLRRMANSEK